MNNLKGKRKGKRKRDLRFIHFVNVHQKKNGQNGNH